MTKSIVLRGADSIFFFVNRHHYGEDVIFYRKFLHLFHNAPTHKQQIIIIDPF